jgi:hypothetical protein
VSRSSAGFLAVFSASYFPDA